MTILKKDFGMAFKIIVLFSLISCALPFTSQQEGPEKKRAILYYDHGTELLVKQEYTKALDNLLKAVELDPYNSQVHNNLGMAYYFKNASEKAITHLEKALSLDSKNSDARVNLASIHYYMGDLNKAEEQYKLVLQDLVYEHQYRTHYNLSLIHLKRGKLKQAMQSLELSLKENPHYCPTLFELGRQHYEQKNYQLALEKLKDAELGACYQNPAPQYYLGLVYLKLGNRPKAKEKFQLTINNWPKTYYAKLSEERLERWTIDELRAEDLPLQNRPEYDTTLNSYSMPQKKQGQADINQQIEQLENAEF